MRGQPVLSESFSEKISETIVNRNCCEQENYEDAAPNFVARNRHSKREQTCKQKARINCTEKANAHIGDSRVSSKNIPDQERYDKGSRNKNYSAYLKEVIAKRVSNCSSYAQRFVGKLGVASEHKIKLVGAHTRSRGNHNHRG